jgi:hypothetical protein
MTVAATATTGAGSTPVDHLKANWYASASGDAPERNTAASLTTASAGTVGKAEGSRSQSKPQFPTTKVILPEVGESFLETVLPRKTRGRDVPFPHEVDREYVSGRAGEAAKLARSRCEPRE